MPNNTTVSNPGTPVEYQNPTAPVSELDSEVISTDINTSLPVTREYVVPVSSISGQSGLDSLLPILAEILSELRKIRFLTEAGMVPGTLDDQDDLGDNFDNPDVEFEES